MVYRIFVFVMITILLLITSIAHLVPSSKQTNDIMKESIKEEEDKFRLQNEPTTNRLIRIGSPKENFISNNDRDKTIDQIMTQSSVSSSHARTLDGWLGGYMSAREIDHLSSRRNININVLSNINLAEIVRAYRGEPRIDRDSGERSGDWWIW